MEVYPQLADCIALPKENIAVESILESGAQVVFSAPERLSGPNPRIACGPMYRWLT